MLLFFLPKNKLRCLLRRGINSAIFNSLELSKIDLFFADAESIFDTYLQDANIQQYD